MMGSITVHVNYTLCRIGESLRLNCCCLGQSVGITPYSFVTEALFLAGGSSADCPAIDADLQVRFGCIVMPKEMKGSN